MRGKAGKIGLYILSIFIVIGIIRATEALSQPGPPSGNSVQIVTKEGLGSFLADSKGMTLYYFKKDTPGKSVCVGPCLEKWPIFYAEKVGVTEPLKVGDFGMITRDDGKKQSTYKGLPLYYFFKDKAAGEPNGQGVNDVWFVVKP